MAIRSTILAAGLLLGSAQAYDIKLVRLSRESKIKTLTCKGECLLLLVEVLEASALKE
jgi:hypothetical protein